MRKLALTTLILALAAAMAVAQETPANPSTTASDQIASNSPNTFQGCLAGKDGNFTFTDQKSGTAYRLSGKDDALKPHVGHMVEVTGSVKVSDDKDKKPTIKVESSKMIADNCNASAATASAETTAVAPAAPVEEAKPAEVAPATEVAVTPAPVTPAPEPAPAPEPTPAPATNVMPQSDTTPAPATTAQAEVTPAPAAETKTEELPQTASPLPFMGLLGFGSLVTGLISRFRK